MTSMTQNPPGDPHLFNIPKALNSNALGSNILPTNPHEKYFLFQLSTYSSGSVLKLNLTGYHIIQKNQEKQREKENKIKSLRKMTKK